MRWWKWNHLKWLWTPSQQHLGLSILVGWGCKVFVPGWLSIRLPLCFGGVWVRGWHEPASASAETTSFGATGMLHIFGASMRCRHHRWMLPKWWKERGDSQNCRLKTWKIVFFLTRSRCRWTDVVWKEIPLVFILGIHISIHKYVANIYVQNSRKLWQSLSQKHINPIWAVPSWPWLFAVYQGSETSQWYFKGNPNYKTTPTKQQGCKKMELLTTKVSFNAVDGRNPAPPGMYKTM